MDTRYIDMVFPFLDEEDLFKSHPSRYLSHLIGHEGPGSLLAYLKKKGWVNDLSAGATPVTRGAAFFHVNIKLTEDGLGKIYAIACLYDGTDNFMQGTTRRLFARSLITSTL